MPYDAFISYSQAREAAVARAIQSGLHRFARPWYRLRALRLFRDVTNLSANPGLWSAIERALGEARYLLLLASPQAAASRWVQREVEWWLSHRPADHLLLVLVEGEIRWDYAAGDFDWTATTVLPRGLAGVFREEPLYIDFRGCTAPEALSLTNPAFSERIASLAATLHGRPKDEMIGEDVRQHRQAMRAAWTAVAILAILTVTAATAAFVAVRQRNIAEQRRQLAVGRELVARAELLRGDRPELHPAGLLLAAEGLRRLAAIGASTWEADQALRRALALSPETIAEFEHDEPVTIFALSPDGTRVAGGTRHGLVRMWSVGASRESMDARHGDRVAALAFSADGARLASAGWDGIAYVMDVAGGGIVWTLRHRAPVWGAAFDPAGRRLVTAGGDGLGHVWDLASGREEATLPHGQTVAGVRFSPDGRFLALQGADGVTSLYETAKWSRLAQVPQRIAQLDAVVFSADGRRMATRSLDDTLLLDLEVGRTVARIAERPLPAGIIVEGVSWTSDAVAFSADSRWLFLASRDRTARIVDAATGNEVRTIPHDQPVRGVAASADGRTLATRSGTVVRLWDALTGVETGRLNHERIVTHLAFNGTGDVIATVAGAQVRLWRTNSGNPLLSVPHARGVWERLFSPDGRWIISQHPHQSVAVWEAATGRPVAQLSHPDLIRNARFSADGNQVATACNDRRVRIWEIPSGRLLAAFDTPMLPGPLAFDSAGNRIAVIVGGGGPDESGALLLWDWRDARLRWRREMRKECRDVAFSPDGGRIAFSDAGPSLHLVALDGAVTERTMDGYATSGEPFARDGRTLVAWRQKTVVTVDFATGKPVHSLDLDATVRSAVMAAGTGTLAIIAEDNSVRLWRGLAGERPRRLPHELPVNAVRFSRDGQWLATGSGHPITGRGEARIWAVADGSLSALQPHDRGVWVVDLNPSGSRMATLARDLPTRVWITTREGLLAEANLRATRNLTYAEWQQFFPREPYRLLCERQPVHPSVRDAVARLILQGDEAAGLRLGNQLRVLRREPKNDVAVREDAARALVEHGVGLARDGKVPDAIRGIRRAQELAPRVVIAPATWNQLAWAGCTRGQAREVLFAAELAVQAEPQNLNFRDTRGLARALTGNVPGAVEDFKAFVDGAAKEYPAKMIEQRRLWLAGLVLDRNPFSGEVLASLRDE